VVFGRDDRWLSVGRLAFGLVLDLGLLFLSGWFDLG
jgi:hypothetical protein